MFKLMKALVKDAPSNFIRAMTSNIQAGRGVNTSSDYYVWIDLEMTGLDENVHKIVEVACILTNDQLNLLHDGIDLVVHQPKEVLDRGNEWTLVNFAQNGLREQSLHSKISIEEADKLVADYIKNQTNYNEFKGKYYLAGNSVYMDKRFLEKYMVNVNEMLHYRLIDVSTIKTLCSHWYPEIFNGLPSKEYRHRALSDIVASINELKSYRENFFKAVE